MVAVQPGGFGRTARADALGIARQILGHGAADNLGVAAEEQRRARTGDFLEPLAIRSVHELGEAHHFLEPVVAVVDESVGRVGGHVAGRVVTIGAERRRYDGVRARAARRRVGVGADRRIGGHVTDAVIGEGLRQRAVGRVGRRGQPVEIVVAIGPALAGQMRGDAVDPAGRAARIVDVLQGRAADDRIDRHQPVAGRVIAVGGDDAVRAGEYQDRAGRVVGDARHHAGDRFLAAGAVVTDRRAGGAAGIAVRIGLPKHATAGIVAGLKHVVGGIDRPGLAGQPLRGVEILLGASVGIGERRQQGRRLAS